MLTFERTRDFALVRRVLTHPTQYRMASEDATPAPVAFAPNEDEQIVYLAARCDGALLGVFTLLPQNAVCFEIHAALLPAAWGDQTRPALRGAIAWAFENTPARRVVASIPAYNRLAIRLARDAGMRAHGRNPRSFLRWGELHDQMLLGISKPEIPV